MANTRLSMRKIKEVLRLTHDKRLSEREVAQSLELSRSTNEHGVSAVSGFDYLLIKTAPC